MHTKIDPHGWLANTAMAGALWGAIIVSGVAAVAGPAGPMPGDRVTITMAGRGWCATITSTDAGADGLPWAWVTIDADARRVVHWPAAELVPGCRK